MPAAADLSAILLEAERALAAAGSPQELIEVRARFLGKKGSLSGVLRGLGALAPDERAALGAAANEAKARIEGWADARKVALEAAGQAESLTSGRLDVSLPGAAAPRGHLHPVSVIEREVSAFFTTLGYSIEDGPEVETDWNNFGALNFPEDHPARELQDTFFVEGGHVLRTHTSPVQIRTMTGRTPPFRFVVPGRVYRNDLPDATHSPMFHQIEGFCVGENVSFADLKGTLYAFAKHLFGAETKLRFRAHFFPFTEPSAEMDVTWRGGWVEWGGCGMIHPRVLLNCGVDPERWQGFAFGMALDRPALLRFGLPSLQLLFDGDLRVLEQLMKVPLGWLAEWIDLPPSLDTLVDRLTAAGLEVEEILRTGPDLDVATIGLVLERRAHPDADRLSVCRVDVGGPEPLEIVCGAPNVAAGQKVAVALVGAELPGGLRIKKSKIRGVVSNGMICSALELGLGESADGILVLDAGAQVGAKLSSVLAGGETVLDVEITPNRGDWVSLLGMAREVRASFGGTLRLPETGPPERGAPAADAVKVGIEDRAGCARYAARVVRGVRVGPSPDWLARRIEAAGFRSINAVVDVTNLVMLEFGQPLHAFDLARVRGRSIRVRAAEAGEKLRTLDGHLRELAREDLVIADAEGAVAVAGVMGGADSEVTEATREVLLESAYFDPPRVRRTAKRLGLSSDASYRFERGVDPDGQVRAADRAARLIAELTGGEVARGVVMAEGEPVPVADPIALSPARVNRLLGTQLAPAEVQALLARVEVKAEPRGDGFVCQPPRYRPDLRIAADLVEEVARIHGYDRIPSTLPGGAIEGVSIPPRRETREAVRSALVAAGFTEVMTYPFVSSGDAEALRLAVDDPQRRAVRVVNPIQSDKPWLRTQLVASVLRTAHANRARQVEEIRAFELARVFRAGTPGALPDEPIEAVAVLARGGAKTLWGGEPPPVFFEAKGAAERLLAELGVRASFRGGDVEPFLHPGAAGEFRLGKLRVATVGELHPSCSREFELDGPVALLIADVDALDRAGRASARYREVSRFPSVQRDLAVLLARDVEAGAVADALREAGGEALQSVRVFDRFAGRGVPDGKVSVAFRLVFQRLDRTLTEPEVSEAMERVMAALTRRFGAELR